MSKLDFDSLFKKINQLNEDDINCWLFHPGMLFGSREKWWGEGGFRSQGHEGLDFCFYQDAQGAIWPVHSSLKIPALNNGVVIRIVPDFLGQSIFVQDFNLSNGQRSCLIYGHLRALKGIETGCCLTAGQALATIAPLKKQIKGLSPHLHISAMDINPDLSEEELDWKTINSRDRITLKDPLSFITCRYKIVKKFI